MGTTVWTTQSRPTPTGTPGAAIRISPSMSPTARPTPSHTELNLMMNGTMRMLTSGAAKDGAVTTTSTADPLPSTMPPRVLLVPARHTTPHGREMLRLQATTTMLGPSRHMDKTTTPDGASLTTQLKHVTTPTNTTLVKSVPMTTSGLRTATSTPRVQLMPDTTTTPGPNRPMVRTRMPDGASLTTASPLALTTTRSTPDGSRLIMTSGLRTTTASTTPMPVHTARPLPSGLRANPAKRDGANPTGALVANTKKPLALDVLLLMANPDLTGTHGAVTRTSRSTNHMNRHGLSPTMLSHMTNGTTSTEINGAPRHGARTAIFTVLLHTMVLLPLLTTPTKPMAAKLDMPRSATAGASAESLMVASLMAVQNLLLTTRPPQARRPLLVPTMPTHGPSRLTALTTTPGGASPMTSSTPTSTTMSSTPARCALTTTSGPRTGMSTPREILTFMAKPQALSALNQRSPRPLTHLMSAMADMAMVMAATDGEHHT